MPYPHKTITAKEKWQPDEDKKKLAEDHGFEVYVIWESEINRNLKEVENNLLARLTLKIA